MQGDRQHPVAPAIVGRAGREHRRRRLRGRAEGGDRLRLARRSRDRAALARPSNRRAPPRAKPREGPPQRRSRHVQVGMAVRSIEQAHRLHRSLFEQSVVERPEKPPAKLARPHRRRHHHARVRNDCTEKPKGAKASSRLPHRQPITHSPDRLDAGQGPEAPELRLEVPHIDIHHVGRAVEPFPQTWPSRLHCDSTSPGQPESAARSPYSRAVSDSAAAPFTSAQRKGLRATSPKVTLPAPERRCSASSPARSSSKATVFTR